MAAAATQLVCCSCGVHACVQVCMLEDCALAGMFLCVLTDVVVRFCVFLGLQLSV
jgi:hypothetical protein